jgi:carbamoyltransferase
LWIQPASGDAGGALGVAQLIWHHVLAQPRNPRPIIDSQQGSLLGPAFSDVEVRKFLDSAGARYHAFDGEAPLVERVASLLAEGKIVGWFRGRMEFGPRALGARSIIGDARSEKMQATMNLKIKFRESFRPFAPCVLREQMTEYFDLKQESPYMLLVAPVQEVQRSHLSAEQKRQMTDPDLRKRVNVIRSTVPSVTHVDYSARVQTVDEERHGAFYRLMKRFKEITGCPVIVNTSFNIRGEPIVCRPEEAHRCFMSTFMDVLVLENTVLLKEEQPDAKGFDPESYKASFKLD